MLARHLPGERRSVVLVQPNMITEVLMRSGRSNRLPLADPIEDGFVPRPSAARPAAGGSEQLEDGDRLLLDDAALLGRRRPGGPEQQAARGARPGRAHRAARALRAARDRPPLPLRPVARSDGFVVVELETRAA